MSYKLFEYQQMLLNVTNKTKCTNVTILNITKCHKNPPLKAT